MRTLFAVLISVVLLVAACGDSDDEATDPEDLVTVISSTTQPTTTQATTPRSTQPSLPGPASAPPAETTAAPSTSEVEDTTTTTDVPGESNLSVDDDVSTVGLGPVFVGMTVDEATQAGGTPFEPEGDIRGRCTFYRAVDFTDGVSWLVAFDRVAVVHVDSGPITTRSGLGVGSTAQQVRDTFGDQIEEHPSPFDPAITELVFVPTDENDARQRVIFEIDGSGNVARYHSGQLPEVEYSRDCKVRPGTAVDE